MCESFVKKKNNPVLLAPPDFYFAMEKENRT